MERQVIADVARRVKKMGRYTETAELQAKALRDQGYSTAKIQSEVLKTLRADKDYARAIAEETGAYKREIKELINEKVKEAKRAGNDLIANAGDMAWNDDLQMWKAHNIDLKKDNSLSQLQQAFIKQTQGQLKNITRTTGFKGTLLGEVGVTNAFQRSMDLATLKVASGTFSYGEAVRDCVKMLSKSGLRSIDYASGRSYDLDTAARMIVRTGMSQLAGQVTMMNCEKTGQDLVYVGEHAGARPEHAQWQGAVYSLSGKSGKYADFHRVTDYGSPTGLKGVNCTHNFYPYWEGDVIPEVQKTEEVEYNGQKWDYYEATQQQRAMERQIRRISRELDATKAIDGDTTQLQAELNNAVNKYTDFSKQTGIRAKSDRLGGAWHNIDKQTRRDLMDAKAKKVESGNQNDYNIFKKRSTEMKAIDNAAKSKRIAYNKVKARKEVLTPEEIINRIGGPDNTVGSCASLTLCYIGQTNGFDVLDFRGGASRKFFSSRSNRRKIMEYLGVQSETFTGTYQWEAGNKALDSMIEGKEYALAVGRHTAIVRKNNGINEYLELQGIKNGWNSFKSDTFIDRFACSSTASGSAWIYDIKTVSKLDEFKDVLGYINTKEKKQRKGIGGGIK